MPRYVVETFVAGGASRECTASEWRVRSAAAVLRRQGVRVRFDRVIRAPEGARCAFVVEAASAREARLTAELAELERFRIVEAASVRL